MSKQIIKVKLNHQHFVAVLETIQLCKWMNECLIELLVLDSNTRNLLLGIDINII